MELAGLPVSLVARAALEVELALSGLLVERPLAFVSIAMLVNFSTEAVSDDLTLVHSSVFLERDDSFILV